MAVDSLGTKRQPQFLDGGAPDIAVDPTAVADYAAYVGNRIVGTTAERTAATSWPAWDNLRWGDTTDGFEYVFMSGAWMRGALTNLQLDTTNSTAFMVTQYGIGRIVGSGTNTVNETVTFPVAFAAVPFVQVMGIGIKSPTGGAYNPAGTLAAGYAIPSAYNLTATSFIANLTTYTGTFGASADFYYSWQATGTLA